MIDAEVLRLRRLRDIALRTRALANFLDSESAADRSVFTRSAVTCWTVARIATGRLRAHPYLSYQRDPSRLQSAADRLFASMLALTARRGNRSLSVCGEQLQAVVREVDDVRALTWSPDLSDALGRMQIQIRRLANELQLGAGIAAGGLGSRDSAAARPEETSLDELAVETSWPYLAI